MYKYKYLNKINNPQDLKKLTISDLITLSQEIREYMIESIMYSGGHLGSSLGAVEICVALHKVFNAPFDKIIFDIGHQAYAHKIITERREKFRTIRQKNGLYGFSYPSESIYDEFIGGHSSTSLSTALGIKKALELKGENDASVVAVIGDAAIGAGMALEAINDIGSAKSKVIIILNDNNMSISKTQGALKSHFSKLRMSEPALTIKEISENIVKKLPNKMVEIAKSARNKFLQIVANKHGTIFEDLGFMYIGPVDGHDLKTLVEILSAVKKLEDNKPILLHVVTKKGQGHLEADTSQDCLHGIEGEINKSDNVNLSNSTVFTNSLIEYAREDQKIIAVSAAMLKGTGLEKFQNIYPSRTFDVGIAEQHAVTFAAGLAKEGLKPFVAIYSTFMQRAYDQVVHDVSLSSLPVRFVMDRAGLVGQDGETHAGVLDYAMFLPLPNIVFMVPSCQEDISIMVKLMQNINDKPSFMRFSKAKLSPNKLANSNITMGKGYIVQKGQKIAVLTLGEVLLDILECNNILLQENIDITIADARFAKPIDENLIIKLGQEHEALIVIEEGLGGIFSSLVVSCLEKNNLLRKIKYRNICYPDYYISHATVNEQKDMAGFTVNNFYNIIKSMF